MTPSSRKVEAPKSYYDVPMLKPPVWKWEIATYFFLGGLSAGAYLLARMASRFGSKRYKDIEEAGILIAAIAFVPCAPLLIRDLGDWKRFHYMLRVFKPKSPMNLGTWVLTGYGAFVTLAALKEWRKSRNSPPAALETQRHREGTQRKEEKKKRRKGEKETGQGTGKGTGNRREYGRGCPFNYQLCPSGWRGRAAGAAAGGVYRGIAQYDGDAALGAQELAGRVVQRVGGEYGRVGD